MVRCLMKKFFSAFGFNLTFACGKTKGKVLHSRGFKKIFQRPHSFPIRLFLPSMTKFHFLDPYRNWFPNPEVCPADAPAAFGGSLSPKRLETAYKLGFFPWFNPGEPILWWHPDPRMVLFPSELKIAKSMKPLLNQNFFEVTINQNFVEVMEACGNIYRPGQSGTWISDEVIEAYAALHKSGHAHSIEVWKNNQLVGGLYGVQLGQIFFGESMFSRMSNASKFGFIKFVKWFEKSGGSIVDCQIYTAHLHSLGARLVSRSDFLKHLKASTQNSLRLDWEAGL